MQLARRLVLAGPTCRPVAFPERPVRALVGFLLGSIPDLAMRLLAPGSGERLGHPVIVEGRPGPAGAIAAEALTCAPAGGYPSGRERRSSRRLAQQTRRGCLTLRRVPRGLRQHSPGFPGLTAR
jgi:tripartite-type tricarboxylate transporter receptor subunit TctC